MAKSRRRARCEWFMVALLKVCCGARRRLILVGVDVEVASRSKMFAVEICLVLVIVLP